MRGLRLEPTIAAKGKEKQVEGGKTKLSQKSVKATVDTKKELANIAGCVPRPLSADVRCTG